MGSALSHCGVIASELKAFLVLTVALLAQLCPCICKTPLATPSKPEDDKKRIVANSGPRQNSSSLSSAVEQGKQQVEACGTGFSDDGNFETPSAWKGIPVEWKRSSEIAGKSTGMFDSGVHPDNVQQGKLGTCYFLCAISSLAENENNVKRIYAGTNSDGTAHCVCFFHHGAWTPVIVDNRFPVQQSDGKMLACNSLQNGGHLWPCVYEKAWAKLCAKDYLKVEGGRPAYTLRCLTGAPSQLFAVADYSADEVWDIVKMSIGTSSVVCASIETMSLCGALCPFHPFNQCISKCMRCCVSSCGAFGRVLYAWLSCAWRLATAIAFLPFYLIPGCASCITQTFNASCTGLASRHAYSIIEAIEAPYLGCASKRLVKVRNPWGAGGHTEWKRSWSDDSCCWSLNGSAKEACRHEAKDDGCFWMSLDDFIQFFTSVSVCTVSQDNSSSMQQQAATPSAANSMLPSYLNSVTYECSLSDAAGSIGTFVVPGNAETVNVWISTDNPSECDHDGIVANGQQCIQVWETGSQDLIGSNPVKTLSKDPFNLQYMPLATVSTTRLLLQAGKEYCFSVHIRDTEGNYPIVVTLSTDGASPPQLMGSVQSV